MNRMLKTIGLALCAAFALSAVAAASASAAEIHHFGGPVGASLEVVANTDQVFKGTTPDEKEIVCKKVSVVGSLGVATDDELTVKPKYETCEAIEGAKKVAAFVDTSACAYVFQGETTPGNPTKGEHANVLIEPVSGATCHINVTVTALKLKCVSIPNQTVTDAVTYEQIENIGGSGKKGIRVNATPHSIESTTTHSAGCPTPEQKTVVHPGHTENSGTYVGSVDVALIQTSETKDFTLTQNST